MKASAPDTVLIDVTVHDPSPVRARDIADALSDEFVVMARELEPPERGGAPMLASWSSTRASFLSTQFPKTSRTLSLASHSACS